MYSCGCMVQMSSRDYVTTYLGIEVLFLSSEIHILWRKGVSAISKSRIKHALVYDFAMGHGVVLNLLLTLIIFHYRYSAYVVCVSLCAPANNYVAC